MKEYAMYRGDKFIDLGTAKELAERHSTTIKTIWWYAGSRKARTRIKGDNGLIIIPIDDEEEE